ncbi:ribonuclease D [Kiloniella laminariae]|uniref:Ribonuclease D n=1 Tax=Kiloniella laminariae TaxID=454162 RepID=A0ABT4LKC9_9PROT|nr:ribonuclease D [Kiloniella laminariae]MCZ4281541.1 ribonuclease D [Kiloniella laminariae]
MSEVTIHLHQTDLPDGVDFGGSVAVDSETMGLNLSRDRLCLVQLSAGDGVCHLVQFKDGNYDAPNLRALFTNRDVTKIFHFARFDLAAIERYLGVTCNPVYCTKIASKLIRTYTDRHGLKELCRELLGVDISKQQQSSDWGSPDLSQDQLNYAASDVLYLHKMVEILDQRLAREGRLEMARACFEFLPWRAKLDLAGWPESDIFAHA